ncbi:hypothetical protein SE336_00395 [Xanthomonas arboricola]|uniref:hypothetical protein n=1 Tax=Xanthomonas arboricola TaxID=56448 RepID=UPI0039F5B70C
MPWLLSRQSGPIAQGFNQASAALAPIAPMMLGMFSLAVLALFVRSHQRRELVELLDTPTTLEGLAGNGWYQFKLLVCEAVRSQSYAKEEIGSGGADGGIDLTLSKDGRHTLLDQPANRSRSCRIDWSATQAGSSCQP